MLKITSRALCVLTVMLAAACSDNPAAPLTFVGPPNLVSTDIRIGDGAAVAPGQTATVHYALWLYDPYGPEQKGALIQNSRQSGTGQPIAVSLQQGQVIQGWVEGVPGMRIGGTRRLIIPPTLAYGSTGNVNIPANAWLVFDIDLLGVS